MEVRQRKSMHSRFASTDCTPKSSSHDASMLYSMLPSAVSSRLPRLPSLRRSVSMYGIGTRRSSANSEAVLEDLQTTTPGTRTPEYTSAIVLRSPRGALEEEMTEYFDGGSGEEELAQVEREKVRQTRGMELTETKSGIEWKFANQGLNLLSLAVEESSTISQDSRFGNASFARQLYVHALTYLLRALPTDMTTEEQLSVRSALPQGVVEPLHVDLNTGFNTQTIHPSPPSLLHKTLASTIIQLVLLFQFILPYLKSLLTAAYQYDREHKISEKILSHSIETAEGLGKTGLGITAAVYGIGDGRVGQLITQTAAWVVEGVTGGIHEGVGESMVIIGAAQRKGDERRDVKGR